MDSITSNVRLYYPYRHAVRQPYLCIRKANGGMQDDQDVRMYGPSSLIKKRLPTFQYLKKRIVFYFEISRAIGRIDL